jgi:hypothetical protein
VDAFQSQEFLFPTTMKVGWGGEIEEVKGKASWGASTGSIGLVDGINTSIRTGL